MDADQKVNFFLQQGEWRGLREKAAAGERFSEEEALRLFESKDLNALGALASVAGRRKNGARASYIVNRYINYSNYCILSCQFCAFARRPHEKEGQFTYDIDEMTRQAKEAFDASDRYVRNQPWEAIGIAALAGVAVWFLLSSRR